LGWLFFHRVYRRWAIAGIPDEDLGAEVQMAWGPMTIEHMMAHGYWNMSYHEGQINYLGAKVG
jgi:hypothetical protein